VTEILYATRGWAVAVKVVNISDKSVWIDARTPVARVVEHGCYPKSGRYVRPGRQKYREWQQLIYENASSPRERERLRRLAELEASEGLPMTNTPDYDWPTKIMLRPKSGTGEVRIARLHHVPVEVRKGTGTSSSEAVCDVEVQVTTTTVDVSTQTEPVLDGGITPSPDTSKTSSKVTVKSDADAGPKDCRPDLSVRDDFEDDDESVDLPGYAMPSTPVEKLEEEYIRCMRVNQEELDLEPGVYIHEGSDLMFQLRDELALLPELRELSPVCDISKADVGVPGRTTSIQDRKIFLGDGNAAPAPARGVECDLDVGNAKPVAQHPRSIAPHIALKVYELLKKLLETGLIELSDSPWASPIVIVLKKNGVDIRMCIDYRVVNGFITLSNYPLPLIDDLLIGFESAMWFMSLDMATGFWAIRMTERAKLISAFTCPFGHFQWVRMPFGLKNAPLVYQAVINNCLWGFVRLSREKEEKV